MKNEKVAKMQDKRMGVDTDKWDKPDQEKKPLPKFSCRVRRSKFDDLEVTVFIPRKYAEKVLSDHNEE